MLKAGCRHSAAADAVTLSAIRCQASAFATALKAAIALIRRYDAAYFRHYARLMRSLYFQSFRYLLMSAYSIIAATLAFHALRRQPPFLHGLYFHLRFADIFSVTLFMRFIDFQ
jgi:hypothetical protein